MTLIEEMIIDCHEESVKAGVLEEFLATFL